MSARSFLDSNILVYTDDSAAPDKQFRARALYKELRRDRTGVVSTQVLQEYFVSTTRKLGVDAPIARRKIELFSHLDLIQIGLEDILAAIDLQRLHSLSFWDGLIVHAALSGGCKILYSEEMQTGRRFGDLAIRNPFIS